MLLLMIDCLAPLVGILIASTLVHGTVWADAGWITAALVLPIFIAIGLGTERFHVHVALHIRSSVGQAVRDLIAAAVAFVLIGFALKVGASISRATLGGGVVLGAGLVAAGRVLIARHARALLGGDPWDVLLIRDDGVSVPAQDGVTVIDARTLHDPGIRTPEALDRLARAIGTADRVVVSCPPERRDAWAAALRGANVQGEIAAPELGHLSPQTVSRLGPTPTLVVARGPLRLSRRAVKRISDLALAIPLLILCAPLMLAVALAIRVGGGGPVLFVQTRIGRQNRQFRMLKFRTMRPVAGDDHGARSASRRDDRVTPLGRILRATSIDELPQLFNVLVGDMSVVGPRPHALHSTAADQLFWEVDPRYWDRHVMRPGLTGLAQVRGFRGATASRRDLENRLRADLEYVTHWSLWLDLVILIRTARVMLHRNAF